MKALTANRLLDGEVVFWRQGQWVDQFADAQFNNRRRNERRIRSAAG